MLNDAFSLGRGAVVDQLIGFQMTKYMQKEEEYAPWIAALDAIQYIELMFSNSAAMGALQVLFLSLQCLT